MALIGSCAPRIAISPTAVPAAAQTRRQNVVKINANLSQRRSQAAVGVGRVPGDSVVRRRGPRGRGGVVAARAAIAEEGTSSPTNFDRVSVLAEALPYLQRFAGQTIVVKYGGAAMKDPQLKDRVVRDVVLLSTVGIRPILVHGGGPEINQWLGKVGIEPKFLNGLRVTDADTMEIVEMVLVGKVNKSIVSLINCAGGRAVGLCGKDGNLLRARVRDESLGFVGEVTSVDTSVIKELVAAGNIPVVATVAMDESGQALNVNADTAAGEIAASIGAAKLILMTDVPGVCTDKDDPSSLVRELDITSSRKLIAEGVIAGGMIPKVECCVRSIAQGVKSAHIIDGRAPHSLLLEILTDEGAGTMIEG